MNPQKYKFLFMAVLVICFALSGALMYIVWDGKQPVSDKANVVAAKGPDTSEASPITPASSTSIATSGLTPVQLSPQRMQAIGLTTAVVEMQPAVNDLRVPGNVEVNERQLAYVQTRFPGWVQKAFANATYQYVHKGEPLFTIYSQELVSTEQEYLLAKQNEQAFATDMHGTAAKERDWLLQAASDRLSQFGVPRSELDRLERTGTVQHDITIESPASGFITEFNALPNQYVQAETKLYTIADLSSVWVYANVNQTDIGQLKPGTPATVTVDAYPGRTFYGRIDQVLPQVDPATRTARVRFVFSNSGLLLKPGMFVNVDLKVPLGRQLVIPASGALQAGAHQIAFLDRGDGYLQPREIEIGPRLDDHIVVLKGLRAGDRIVSSANFLVDSEAQLQAAIGSFAPTPQATGAGNGATQQANPQFTTDPSPPRKGTNTVKVKLASPDGKPVVGANVNVNFYMPAMPAMGMAAVNKAATLTDNGDGTYQGSVELPSGGSYQVTIAARRGNQMLATSQFNANVTGGM